MNLRRLCCRGVDTCPTVEQVLYTFLQHVYACVMHHSCHMCHTCVLLCPGHLINALDCRCFAASVWLSLCPMPVLLDNGAFWGYSYTEH